MYDSERISSELIIERDCSNLREKRCRFYKKSRNRESSMIDDYTLVVDKTIGMSSILIHIFVQLVMLHIILL